MSIDASLARDETAAAIPSGSPSRPVGFNFRAPGSCPTEWCSSVVAKPLASAPSTALERTSGVAGGHQCFPGRVGLLSPLQVECVEWVSRPV
jgi:hypothetical protein